MFTFADVVWPALVLETRILSVWNIALGLAIEGAFIYYIYRAGLRQTAIMTLAINACSTIAGIILIPLLGVAWEFFPGMLLYPLFKVGTFNIGTWMATLIMATASNTLIETWALKRFFKRPVTPEIFRLLFLANALSVSLALASLSVSPAKLD